MIRNYKWTIYNGSKVKLREMTDGHLRNAYNHVLKAAFIPPFEKKWIKRFQREILRRQLLDNNRNV